MEKKKGFTLAEVLITLGIIGVVAAMTMPVLISNYKKHEVVTKLKKFHSVMNQALKMSEIDNAEFENWDASELKGWDGETLYTWYNKYFAPYFTSKEIEKLPKGILVKLTDGSEFVMYNGDDYIKNLHIVYCINHKACKDYIDINGADLLSHGLDGKTTFFFAPRQQGIITYHSGYKRDKLMNDVSYGCNSTLKLHCAALIEADGWQIKEDYPVRF